MDDRTCSHAAVLQFLQCPPSALFYGLSYCFSSDILCIHHVFDSKTFLNCAVVLPLVFLRLILLVGGSNQTLCVNVVRSLPSVP